MKNWTLKLLKPFIKRYITKKLADEDMQNTAIGIINEKIDIPKLTEKQEEKLLNQIYDALEEALIEIIDQI